MILKVLLQAVGAFVGLYVLAMLWLAARQRDMIYQPDPTLSDPEQAGVPEMVPVPLRTDDGWMITGWYAPPPKRGDRATVVLFHGNSGTIAGRAFKARALLDAGYGVFLVEYRGYGGNRGRPSEAGLYADGRAVIGWLLSRGIPENRLVLYGESLGSGVAMEMTRLIQPRLVVLEGAFTSVPDLAPAYVIPPLAHLLVTDRFDNLAKVRDLSAPLLVVHGEQDTVVPVAMGHALLNAAESLKEGVFLPKGRHNDLWDWGAGPRIIDFLGRRWT